MRRLFIVVWVLSAAIGSADAQQSRERLEGFGGVHFGTSLAEVKRILGANAKEDETARKGGGKLKVLEVEQTFADEAYLVRYIFGSNGALIRVGLSHKDLTGGKDQAACLREGKALQMLRRQYGASDGVESSEIFRSHVFAFKDGNAIKVVNMFVGGCVAGISFHTPQGLKE